VELILVRIPRGGLTVPVSRRELLAALGIGTTLGTLQQTAATVTADAELLANLELTLTGLQATGRIMPPEQLIDPLTGQVGLIDAVRRRAPAALRRGYLLLQTRGAEALSWMAEESGELATAVYWTDRAQQWADVAKWPAMGAYAHVRRSMLAISYAADGMAAADQAAQGLRVPEASARVGRLGQGIRRGSIVVSFTDPSSVRSTR
jgi:hypothetical protein